MTNSDPTKVVTGKVRFSYATLFSPRAISEGDDAKFSVTLLIPKRDTATLTKIKSAFTAARQRYTERNPKAKLPANLATTLHDGDGVRESDGEKFSDECHGCYVMTVSTKKPPLVLDATSRPIADESEIYSGCYGRAIFCAYVYDKKGNKGISAELQAVMKLHDGDPLGGSRATAEDFDDGYQDDDYAALGF